MLFLLLDIAFAQDIWFVRPIDNTTYSGSGTETTSSVPIWWNAELSSYPLIVLGHYYKLITDNGTYSTYGGGTIPGSLNRAPGIYTWRIELHELYFGLSTYQLAAIDTVTFFVKHSINIRNNFDVYASDIKIDNLTQSSNTTVYKYFGDTLPLGAINQEYNGNIYVWKTTGTDLSDWKRKTMTGISFSSISSSKNYNYSVQSNDNGANIIANLKVHSLPTIPAISISGAWGSNPILTFSGGGSDIDYYVLKKEYSLDGGQSFGRVLYVNPASNPYTDPEIVRAKLGGDAIARYSVKVVDLYEYESNYSSTVSADGNSMWKQNSEAENFEVINEYALESNYPNPFNPTTQISYQLPENSFVNLVVYNALGQKVAELVNQHQSSGKYSVKFNAANLPSGVYIYKLQTDKFSDVKKMLLTK